MTGTINFRRVSDGERLNLCFAARTDQSMEAKTTYTPHWVLVADIFVPSCVCGWWDIVPVKYCYE